MIPQKLSPRRNSTDYDEKIADGQMTAQLVLSDSTVFPKLTFAVFLALFVGAGSLAILHIVRGSVDVVYADTWGHIGMVGHFLSGHISMSELYSPHNQNRPILLNIVLLISAQYDKLNLVHVEYLGVVFPMITICVMMYFCYPMFENYHHFYSVFSCITLLMLSLSQWENFLLPINFVFFSTITFSVLSILLLHSHLVRDPPRGTSAKFIAAVVLSVLALFSMGGGFLTWVINIIQLALSWLLLRKRVHCSLLVYIVIACIFFVLYLRSLGQSSSSYYIITHPIDMSYFMLIGLGNAVVGFFNNAPNLQVDMIVGTFLLLTYAFAVKKFFKMPSQEQEQSLGIFCLLLLGLGEEILIGLGRLPMGVGYGASSRYATLTMISAVASLILLSTYTHGSRSYIALAVFLGASMCVFTVLADYQEARMETARKQYSENLRRLLREGQIKDANKAAFEWENVDDIVNGNRILKQYALSLYHENIDQR